MNWFAIFLLFFSIPSALSYPWSYSSSSDLHLFAKAGVYFLAIALDTLANTLTVRLFASTQACRVMPVCVNAGRLLIALITI